MNNRCETTSARRSRWARIAVHAGLPIAIIVAAAMTARAFDTSWIAPGQTLSSAQLKAALDEVQARLAALETRDCPPGYTVSAKPYLMTNPDSVSCKNGIDQVVKVGRGASAFWIDQYEATIWDSPTGSGTQYGVADNDAHGAGFARNGQWTKQMYAFSAKGFTPSRWLTWFQANEACRLGGKRLPTRDEWLAAASGTPDIGANDGSKNAACNTQSTSAALVRATGAGSGSCASRWGAEDMVGNLWEWTGEWYAAPGTGTAFVDDDAAGATNWPADYNGDATWNVNTWTYTAAPGLPQATGVPAAAIRGGAFDNGTRSGLFALRIAFAPSYWAPYLGFRCAVQ